MGGCGAVDTSKSNAAIGPGPGPRHRCLSKTGGSLPPGGVMQKSGHAPAGGTDHGLGIGLGPWLGHTCHLVMPAEDRIPKTQEPCLSWMVERGHLPITPMVGVEENQMSIKKMRIVRRIAAKPNNKADLEFKARTIIALADKDMRQRCSVLGLLFGVPAEQVRAWDWSLANRDNIRAFFAKAREVKALRDFLAKAREVKAEAEKTKELDLLPP